jgi:hypothetical protein
MHIENFKENWGMTTIPTELEKLIYFQTHDSSFENYSQGFGVLIDDKTGLKNWSSNTSFLDKLFPFAQANCSGSFYAIWNNGTTKSTSEMPVVVFGDEGGVHVVAENILQLLHLLTFDTEISVDFQEVSFYKDEADYEESEDLNKFVNWLKEDYGLDQIEEPSVIISAAQKKYKKEFNKWFKQYYK